jgi:Ni/Fe-hydrogenase 1 B-type cytochrome subunit
MTPNTSPSIPESSHFLQQHSVFIRVWHWLTFLVLSAIMITVLLNSTLMNQRKNSVMVQDLLKESGVTVTSDQAFAVSREYEDIMWNLHKELGYALAFLFLARILIELVVPGEEKVYSRVKNAMGLYRQNAENKSEYRHYVWVKRGYLLFYVFLFIMILTGIGLALGRKVSFIGDMHREIKTVHSICQYIMYSFVLLHLFGVIIIENRNAKAIVSGMINGNREMK